MHSFRLAETITETRGSKLSGSLAYSIAQTNSRKANYWHIQDFSQSVIAARVTFRVRFVGITRLFACNSPLVSAKVSVMFKVTTKNHTTGTIKYKILTKQTEMTQLKSQKKQPTEAKVSVTHINVQLHNLRYGAMDI